MRTGLLLISILSALAWPALALADATPVQVVLEYLDGVSNWGSKTASGAAEIVREEGEVRLSAQGLTPMSNAHYVLWLAHEGSDAAFRVGEVVRQPDGTATLDVLLPDAIPDGGWNLALITVEDDPSVSHPGPRRAIAGRYPRPLPQGTLPVGLPNTGGGGGSTSGEAPTPLLPFAIGAVGVLATGQFIDLVRRRNF